MSDLEGFLKELRAERDKLDFAIERAERTLRKAKNVPQKSKTSIPTLAKHILESHPSGLSLQALVAELEKLGYKSRSKNPKNTVNSVLHKFGTPFKRLADGRWILERVAFGPVVNGSTTAHQN
jgi:hypothetical protein